MKSSVAIATYNGAKFILKLLSSIKDQTRKADEVIICDDGSKDDTVALIETFIKDNSLNNWKLCKNDKNLGYAENYRKAFSLTTGDIIFPCDQDDIWVIDRLEKMMSVMEQNKDIGLLNTDYAEFSSDKPDILKNYYIFDETRITKIRLNAKNRFLQYPGCVMAIRKSFLSNIEKYWFKSWAHDEFLWCVAISLNQCYYYRYCSLKRRCHEEQTSGHLAHTVDSRVSYLEGELKSAETLLNVLRLEQMDTKKAVRLYKKNLNY